jgi:DNA polymerase bacteriophage-type
MITIDFETQSEADLRKVGAWRYSEHSSTDVICACWGMDSQPIQDWWPGKDKAGCMPKLLREAVLDGVPVEAHNAAFEISIWENVLALRHGWILPRLDQWRDTMAVACYYGLPAQLDKLAGALGFEGKDPDGNRLISRYSKLHNKNARRDIPDDDFRQFVDYCRRDVRIEQSISDYLGDLPTRELEAFHLDLEKGRRGIYLDRRGIAAASAIVDATANKLSKEFRALTGVNPTQVAKVQDWLRSRGVSLENLQKGTLEDLLEDDEELGQGPARRAIELRLAVSKASAKKLVAMAAAAGADGRARFQTRYHGAQTGRSTGTGFQPLNLKKGVGVDSDQLVRDIMRGDPEWLRALYGDPMAAIANASRHWIMAAPGNKLIAGDYVSIEAVVAACLAGEEWKVQAFRDKVQIYCLMADKIHKLPPGTVGKFTHPAEYKDGKTAELAFQYRGALNAWLKFDNSGRHSDQRILQICRAWRAENPAITSSWPALENAMLEAVWHPGRETTARGIGFVTDDDMLAMILPDGKHIWYFKPEVRPAMPQWHRPLDEFDLDGAPNPCFHGACTCKPRPQVSYMAQKTGQWRRVFTHGGKVFENACQAVSRQILKPAEKRLAKAGYSLILDVYDEIIADGPRDFGSCAEFEALMNISAGKWCADWPIRAEAWEGQRYKK